ncbi:MAG: hypothetical protein LBF00_04130 [Mycoplasmataceae bacterium]|nr:hypothetical protein [Mycoplasmataceae bacterium]
MASFNYVLWIFIGIGFIGAISLTLAAVFNIVKVFKEHTFKHIILKIQIIFAIANITFVIYALGISIENETSLTFWNSTPTWMGNIIPFILNLVLVIGKVIEDKHVRNRKKI